MNIRQKVAALQNTSVLPENVKLSLCSVGGACAEVSENHPPMEERDLGSGEKVSFLRFQFT